MGVHPENAPGSNKYGQCVNKNIRLSQPCSMSKNRLVTFNSEELCLADVCCPPGKSTRIKQARTACKQKILDCPSHVPWVETAWLHFALSLEELYVIRLPRTHRIKGTSYMSFIHVSLLLVFYDFLDSQCVCVCACVCV